MENIREPNWKEVLQEKDEQHELVDAMMSKTSLVQTINFSGDLINK